MFFLMSTKHYVVAGNVRVLSAYTGYTTDSYITRARIKAVKELNDGYKNRTAEDSSGRDYQNRT